MYGFDEFSDDQSHIIGGFRSTTSTTYITPLSLVVVRAVHVRSHMASSTPTHAKLRQTAVPCWGDVIEDDSGLRFKHIPLHNA